MHANTPAPPYYAVIFTSTRTDIEAGYEEMLKVIRPAVDAAWQATEAAHKK